MSKQSFDDSSNLVDIPALTDGDEKKCDASGNTSDLQPDLLSFDDPEPSDLKEHLDKPKSKKSKAKRLFKRAKSPISGAFNKTKKEFEKLSNLPKHHYSSSPKSPTKSPSKENLTEEYSKLEKKLSEKTSEEWLQFQQMQDRIQQSLHKTKSTLSKLSSESEDNEGIQSKPLTTRWTGFEDDSGLEPEVIDTSLNPRISITGANDSELKDSSDLVDTGTDENILIDTTDESSLIDTGFIDTNPLTPTKAFPIHSPNMDDNLMDDSVMSEHENLKESLTKPPLKLPTGEIFTKKISSDDMLGLMDNSEQNSMTDQEVHGDVAQPIDDLDSFFGGETSEKHNSVGHEENSDSILTGYTFTSSGEKVAVDNDILMFEKPLSEIVKTSKPNVKPSDQVPIIRPPSRGEPRIPDVRAPKRDEGELFSLDDDTDLTPVQPMQDSQQGQQFDQREGHKSEPVLPMFVEPLQPVKPTPKPTEKDQAVPQVDEFAVFDRQSQCQSATPTSFLDEFASFDPIKSDTYTSSNIMQSSTSPVNVNVTGSTSNAPMFGSSPQTGGSAYGSMPSSSLDIFSKIKMMSSGSQPVSPARRKVPEKPKDHFGFVKKALKPGEKEDNEEEDGYKPLATLSKKKESEELKSDIDEADDGNAVNNPFLSGSFNQTEVQNISTINAAELFGLEPGTAHIDSGIDDFFASSSDSRTQNDAELAKDQAKGWVDPTAADIVDFGADLDTDTAWDDSHIPVEKKPTVCVWGGEQEAVLVDRGEDSNPFQDDFSKFDEVPALQGTGEAANPFMITDNVEVNVSTANPFFDFGDDKTDDTDGRPDLVGGKAHPATLSDSESFFLDSVADTKQGVEAIDDVFDPFNVTSKSSSSDQNQDSSNAENSESLDHFSSVAASGDKQLAKPSDDDDHSFMLDIKPVTSEKLKTDSLPIAPAIAPPPKAPKSPQPPRINPFDRESPAEEDFAQFDVKDKQKEKDGEKPKEQNEERLPTSMSMESETTTEEEDENLEPLEPFLPECDRDSFKLMLRYPTKKKIAGNRYWKNVCVKIEKQKDGIQIRVLNDARDALPIQELLLQPCYSLSDISLQQYDQYGKIHTCKLQYVFYKERVGIKTERITPAIVKLKKRSEKPKATMILDHSPQVSELLKFGSLDKSEITEFVRKLEDVFMHLEAQREKTLTYTKDEITAEVHDEYYAELDKEGKVTFQKARMRVFVLAFLTGMPVVEIGLNDRRRKGKEVVGRCDIIPIKTEEWIRLENVEFHCSVDRDEFEKTNNIKFRPLDACQFELMRYRVRLRENKELPLQLTIQQIIKNRKCEVRCDLLVTGYHSYSKKHGQFPCEDIEVRFPIPEVWIYMFRYERRFGYGSVHSAARKPGKIKGLERLTMMAQGNLNQALMEADVGTAKYEHVYRAIVWRIPRLPIRNQGAYTSHLFRLKLELGPHDEFPESFETHTSVSFTMPCSTVSQSQIRSIAVTNQNPPEKWVRSSASYEYRIEIEHLDEYPELMAIGSVYKEAARPSLKPEEEEKEERDPRLAQSDSDSSDSD
ncbi:protein stoned-B-like [Mya arenaria]|uniref:protein stoned-B-like n=1 Tax=Mya arenaria TaxID=6604 RepID=UPI0022E41C37|nr:protein stoned-B-like [Mya arenaria]XP_052767362.1 protein stoned-B-like [Mya arenaria]